ncbi:hypothetical protein RYX36_010215 [Vicia faba]
MNNSDSTPDHQDQASKNSITDANNNIVNSLVPAEAISGKEKGAVVQQIQRKRSSKRDQHIKRNSREAREGLRSEGDLRRGLRRKLP